ncbi:flavin-containing monooxygenase FMO GS-OX-like 4 isoform X1 [Prosopis cineraria]|uniref:flavin-containing monooxygenase FMO GS-OX-like 4 isoform X1 n=1 Tax=Prosopis cineraria TaxID=364024 RepID=UPI00240FA283|nr:flavin-containing monooxygenase FMO GS-OX-like 4 isoform X1 [Prosopis cineraria]
MSTAIPPLASRNVAVIGAGASGLAAARELRREGHRVVVFERGDQVGGTWIYTPNVESDLLGTNPDRPVVHSSLYQSLRTNLPREIMGFQDYPFVKRESNGRDGRRFPGHKEVLMYLQDFASAFGINELVRFETEVVSAKLADSGKWRVRSRGRGGVGVDEIYDAVVVCNGHFTQPRIADIPGINVWPGKQMHSHNYRTPEPFQDQVVVVIGNASSGVDISIEISGVAKEVHVASRSVADDKLGKLPGFENMWLHSLIDSVHEDGRVVFKDGNAVCADVILHCTGYKYHFPFLETNGAVTVDDNCVEPLYKHVFPPALAPWLSFVGIPWKVVPFIMCELQSKWIAGILSNRIALPSKEEMMEDVKAFYSSLEISGMPKRYAHCLGKGQQWDYNNWIAAQCGIPPVEEWRQKMYEAASKSRVLKPVAYRDHWEDDDLVLQAQQDFSRCLKS